MNETEFQKGFAEGIKYEKSTLNNLHRELVERLKTIHDCAFLKCEKYCGIKELIDSAEATQ